MAFISVVAHIAGVLGADVCYGAVRGEECEERFPIAVPRGGAVAPCYAVAKGEDEERDAILDADVTIVVGDGGLEGNLELCGCSCGLVNEGEIRGGEA